MREIKVGILGGGLSGLVAALECSKAGLHFEILEATDRLGGLMKTEIINGFVFDIGGSHIIFSKSKSALQFLLKYAGKTITHYRDARIYFNNKYIKYPFENGMYALNPELRFYIIHSYIETLLKREKGELNPPKNFKEWLYYWFGEGLAKIYLEPYNKKIWKYPLDKIGISWVKDRVPNPPLNDILKSAVGLPTEGYKHQINFKYPLVGGIEVIIKNIASELSSNCNAKIYLKFPVERIKYEDKKFIIKSGKKEKEYNVIINTLPLRDFLLMFDETPSELRKIGNKLEWNGVMVLGVAIDRKKISNFHWMYFPQEEILFHRIAFISNYSPYMAPSGKSSVLCEITFYRCTINRPIKSIENEVIDNLVDLKIVKRDEILFVKSWINKYGYPIEHIDYEDNHSRIMTFIGNYNILSVGRWGLWKYLNMDAVVSSTSNIVTNFLHKIQKQ